MQGQIKGDLLGVFAFFKDARDLVVPLEFLGQNAYEALIFADGPDADSEGTSLSIETKIFKPGDSLAAHLAPGGGLAVILTPIRR